MNTEELYIWNYGIDKLPKGLLEFGRSDVCDTYDESKRQKFQNHGQWMWKNKDGWRENLPSVLYLVCNKKPGILQFDFLDKYSIKLKIVSEEFLSLLQENGFVDKYDITTVKVENPLKVVPLIHSNLTPVKFSHSPFCLFLFSSYSSCPLCRVLH